MINNFKNLFYIHTPKSAGIYISNVLQRLCIENDIKFEFSYSKNTFENYDNVILSLCNPITRIQSIFSSIKQKAEITDLSLLENENVLNSILILDKINTLEDLIDDDEKLNECFKKDYYFQRNLKYYLHYVMKYFKEKLKYVIVREDCYESLNLFTNYSYPFLHQHVNVNPGADLKIISKLSTSHRKKLKNSFLLVEDYEYLTKLFEMNLIPSRFKEILFY